MFPYFPLLSPSGLLLLIAEQNGGAQVPAEQRGANMAYVLKSSQV